MLDEPFWDPTERGTWSYQALDNLLMLVVTLLWLLCYSIGLWRVMRHERGVDAGVPIR